MKYIYHHLGLGDHIICNGLVRCMINPNEKYSMFVKEHNLDSVRFMYKDLKNLTFLVGDDDFAKNFIHVNNISKENLIIAGFGRHPNSKEFDDSFYLQNNLPFKYRWEKFYVERDYESEKKIFKMYDVNENDYVFVHDDDERNININNTKIVNKNLKVIKPNKKLTSNIFDYCYLMENSAELHFIDSSFRLLYDSLLNQKENLFYHVNYDGVIRDITTKSQSKLIYNIL
jgi:hypothetical protein